MAKEAAKEKTTKATAKPKNAGKSKTATKPKTATKKAAPSKPAKKTATSKKTTPKKQPPKEPEKKPLFRKRTIAEKTVAFKTTNWAGIFCWVGIVICLILAVFFKFFMLGYSFTVTVLLGITAILLFYGTLIPAFSKNYPMTARRLKRVFTVILCIGLILVAITEFFIIRASLGEPTESCDYVVVLGAKVRESGPSASLWDRIYGARDYLEAHPEVIAIVSGGQGQDEPMTEARAMYEKLVELGIDDNRIWLEENATSTWENLNFSLKLIEEKTGSRPDNIGIVSSEYHLFRASLFAEACNVDSVLIPARTSVFTQRINHFMREVAGVWHFYILGGQYE